MSKRAPTGGDLWNASYAGIFDHVFRQLDNVCLIGRRDGNLWEFKIRIYFLLTRYILHYDNNSKL